MDSYGIQTGDPLLSTRARAKGSVSFQKSRIEMSKPDEYKVQIIQEMAAFMPSGRSYTLDTIFVQSNAFQTRLTPTRTFTATANNVGSMEALVRAQLGEIKLATAGFFGVPVERIQLLDAISGLGRHEWEMIFIPTNSELRQVRIPLDDSSLAKLGSRTIVLTRGDVVIEAVPAAAPEKTPESQSVAE